MWSSGSSCWSRWRAAPVGPGTRGGEPALAIGREIAGAQVAAIEDERGEELGRAAAQVDQGIGAETRFADAEEGPVELELEAGVGRLLQTGHAAGEIEPPRAIGEAERRL